MSLSYATFNSVRREAKAALVGAKTVKFEALFISAASSPVFLSARTKEEKSGLDEATSVIVREGITSDAVFFSQLAKNNEADRRKRRENGFIKFFILLIFFC
jgi:hypothetical protein